MFENANLDDLKELHRRVNAYEPMLAALKAAKAVFDGIGNTHLETYTWIVAAIAKAEGSKVCAFCDKPINTDEGFTTATDTTKPVHWGECVKAEGRE